MTAPKITHEQARKAYHDATVRMAELDAKVIDASATLQELQGAYATSVVDVNTTRERLVEARTPEEAGAEADAPAPPPSAKDGLGLAGVLGEIASRDGTVQTADAARTNYNAERAVS